MDVLSSTNGVPIVFLKLNPEAWQLAQPEVIAAPAWFIVQVWKPFGVVVLEWHNSHAAVVGT